MPRAKGGSKTRRRRKKVLKKAKGYFGGRRKLYRTAAETGLPAGGFASKGRQPQKSRGRPRAQKPPARAGADPAGPRSTSALEQLRVRVLGRSGELTALLRGLGKIA